LKHWFQVKIKDDGKCAENLRIVLIHHHHEFYMSHVKYLLVQEMFQADTEKNEMDILHPVNFSCKSCGFQEIKQLGLTWHDR
jgi:hypothetical protein